MPPRALADVFCGDMEISITHSPCAGTLSPNCSAPGTGFEQEQPTRAVCIGSIPAHRHVAAQLSPWLSSEHWFQEDTLSPAAGQRVLWAGASLPPAKSSHHAMGTVGRVLCARRV